MLTKAKLKELLHYNLETGVFTRLVSLSNAYKPGTQYQPNSHGYVTIRIDRKNHQAHRLAWLYVKGEWPEQEIDHINGVRGDNHWSNLREAKRSENAQNRTAYRCNATGLLGIQFTRGKWQAKIAVHKRQKYLGRYETPEEAHAAYLDAKR